jgi:UDP-glucose 4-epimerase
LQDISIYGDGLQKRAFSDIDDCIYCLDQLITNPNIISETVNIGPDEEFLSIEDLAFKIGNILEFEVSPIYLAGRPQEVFHANCSADLARTLLGYKTTTTLKEGLESLVGWIREKGVRDFSYHLPLEFVTERTPKTWTDKLM